MFEKLFGFKRSEEENEDLIRKTAIKEFSKNGVNGPSMYVAFQAVRERNEKENLGFTNNHLLNLVRDMAIGSAGAVEDTLYGGIMETHKNIESEIARLRSELSDEERRT